MIRNRNEIGAPSAISEFGQAWQALGECDTVALDIDIPESSFGVRVLITRLEPKPELMTPPRVVTLRTGLFLKHDFGAWQPMLLADAPDAAMEALLICRRAIATLIEMAGGEVLAAQA